MHSYSFYSYGGEALDRKTPLLRSMEAINKQAPDSEAVRGGRRNPGQYHRRPRAGIFPH
ncbi:MAG: hypothetical protein ACLRXC_00475 [[Clostridium] leptum]